MLNRRSIRFNLFFSYSSLILCIIVGFITTYYFYTAQALEKKASESLYQLSANIASQMDTNFKEMNSLSQKIISSEPLIQLIYSEMYDENNIYLQRSFNQLIYGITGPQFPFFQINILRKNGNLAGIGNRSFFSNAAINQISKVPWFEQVLKLNGKKYIAPPYKDLINPKNKMIISLCRSFSSSFGSDSDGAIEVQLDYDKVAEIVSQALNAPISQAENLKDVLIFSSDGELIYPANSNQMSRSVKKNYWNEIEKNKSKLQSLTFKREETGRTEMLAFANAGYSGCTVLVTEPLDFLLTPVKDFRNKTLFACLVILMLTLAISYFVSNKLTVPIKNIHKSIRNLSLSVIPVNFPVRPNSRINELEDLNQSFTDMCIRLKGSLEEVVTSRSHEIHSRMLALQSQMNPHFLYNTLSIISIMAEDDGKPRVVTACEDLSNMLRYISSDSCKLVAMSRELEHTLNFLNLLKLRYQDDLKFVLDIPENMFTINVPKLIIQPLVENCTKYGINTNPPWEIEVHGNVYPNHWSVNVHDTGEGFSKTWLEAFKEKTESIDLSNLPDLKLDGMGLLNIYIRLKLMYGESAVFELYNHPDGGAVVNIGGVIQ